MGKVFERFSLKSVKTAFIIAVFAGALTAGVGCGGGSNDDSGDGGGSDDTVVFGIQTHETGALASVGLDKIYGVEAGVDIATNGTNEVEGKKIEFVVADDGSDPGASPQVARQQIQQDDPDVVFGFDSSSSAVATAPIIADAGIPSIFPIAASDELTGFSEWVFRTSRNATQEAQMGATVAEIDEGETYMILAPDYAYGQSAAAAWDKLLTEQGGKALEAPLYAPLEGKDYTSVVERIRNADPDMLVVVTFASASGPLLWQTINNAGIADGTEVVTLLPQAPVREAMGPIARKIRYFAIYDPALPDNKLNDEFVKKFTELSGGTPPDIYAGDSGVAGMMAVKAIEETGGDTSPEALADALSGLEAEALKGPYKVRPEDHTFLQTFYESGLNPDLTAKRIKEFSLDDSVIPVEQPIED
jgi:branched-chain amino acid transport system substrate-binding protein